MNWVIIISVVMKCNLYSAFQPAFHSRHWSRSRCFLLTHCYFYDSCQLMFRLRSTTGLYCTSCTWCTYVLYMQLSSQLFHACTLFLLIKHHHTLQASASWPTMYPNFMLSLRRYCLPVLVCASHGWWWSVLWWLMLAYCTCPVKRPITAQSRICIRLASSSYILLGRVTEERDSALCHLVYIKPYTTLILPQFNHHRLYVYCIRVWTLTHGLLSVKQWHTAVSVGHYFLPGTPSLCPHSPKVVVPWTGRIACDHGVGEWVIHCCCALSCSAAVHVLRAAGWTDNTCCWKSK